MTQSMKDNEARLWRPHRVWAVAGITAPLAFYCGHILPSPLEWRLGHVTRFGQWDGIKC